MKKTMPTILIATLLSSSISLLAHADKLDDIISSGKLRCAVSLDFAPMGSRNASNEPVGFDVDYCNDLAKSLGVKAEIIETTFPDRVPAIVSNRVDVVVASASDTLDRAKVIGFSIPYFAFNVVVLTKADSPIKTYEDLKGRKVGSTKGTYEALSLEKDVEKWKAEGSEGSFRSYNSQADSLLALDQGHIEATVLTNTVAAASIKSGKYSAMHIVANAPYIPDYVALATKRTEYGLINYLNLFINQQVRTGRYQALYNKWIGEGTPSDLTVKGVYH